MHPLFVYPVVIIFLFLLWSITKWWLISQSSVNKNKKLPPSPRKLPIIGNLHQLGSLPNQSLQILSKKHGPLMLLHFGSVPALIVSSAAAAREIMRTHDIDFANRLQIKAFKKLFYDCKDVAVTPYGEYWRQMKSIFVHQLLSKKRVQSFRYIREEETALFIKKIEESHGPVNLNLIELLGAISIGDFIPWLRWINRLNGFNKRVDRVTKVVDAVLESVIQEVAENPEGINGGNFVEIMFDIYKDQSTADASMFDRVSIKALVMDAFVVGTDTVLAALESLMAELFRHPNVMQKLQNEVREIVGGKHDITDDDLEKMNYMKAVIKETLRCHLPNRMLLRKLASKDVKIMGYDVPKGTVVMVNAWTIGRDPEN